MITLRDVLKSLDDSKKDRMTPALNLHKSTGDVWLNGILDSDIFQVEEKDLLKIRGVGSKTRNLIFDKRDQLAAKAILRQMTPGEARIRIVSMLICAHEFCSSPDTRRSFLNQKPAPGGLGRLDMHALFPQTEGGLDSMKIALSEAIDAVARRDG